MYLRTMGSHIKNQKSVLEKLQITELNPMQEAAHAAIYSNNEIILLSPTGTGKTLAFLLPVVAELNTDIDEIQAMIVVPSRELAIQIEQVLREMGTGYKVNTLYGGSLFSKDRTNLQHRPAIVVGTPGRIADHLRRQTFTTTNIKTLVLDEYDKSLEIGFDPEMTEIVAALRDVKKKILTSATEVDELPLFAKITNPVTINFLKDKIDQLDIKTVISPSKDKLETLVKTLSHIGNKPGIIFCNFKESIRRVSEYLDDHNIAHGCFYGGMEQMDRERALIKFRNGTHQILLATDLAARGLDIPELAFIIHYHLPLRSQEFTHRNGRTARMHQEGTAYILQYQEEELPEFIDTPEEEILQDAPIPASPIWNTLFISGGRADKISKGDIAGVFFKQANLSKEQLGIIELKQDCAFVAVHAEVAMKAIHTLDNSKIKKRKVRVRKI